MCCNRWQLCHLLFTCSIMNTQRLYVLYRAQAERFTIRHAYYVIIPSKVNKFCTVASSCESYLIVFPSPCTQQFLRCSEILCFSLLIHTMIM
jgi:hypothetical protein